jgi:hypothetical protein
MKNNGRSTVAAAAEVAGEAAKWDAYMHVASKIHAAVTDNRVMNNMDAGTKAIHMRLEAWARWCKISPELREYPEVSMLGRVEEYGPEAVAAFMAGGATTPSTMPAEVEIVERAVTRLGDIDRKVLTKYYLTWAPAEALARACRMREREFLNVLRRARFRVRCYVEAVET